MTGDFSRLTFDKKKNYHGVLKQQGRVSLDADWNETIDIINHQRKIRTIDTIGVCGAPIHSSGFEIRYPGTGLTNDFLISTGRFYAGGLLCELHPCAAIPIVAFSSNNIVQVDSLEIDDQAFAQDQWVLIFTKETPKGIVAKITSIDNANKALKLSQDLSSLINQPSPYLRRMILYSQQPDLPNASDWTHQDGITDLIYLDVWQRHITAIEDPEVREVALGGPDTATRIQTIAQVKIIQNVGNIHCQDNIDKWNKVITPGSGRLKTQVVPGTKPEDPCPIAEGGGYRGLENRLYRVEIHKGGDLGTATFKWSRDNGSVAYEIVEFLADETDPARYHKIRLKQPGKDQILKIKKYDWVEISEDETDLEVGKAGTITRVEEIDEAQRIITLKDDIATHKDYNHPKIRRWDTGLETDTPPTLTAAGPIKLEDGIEILFGAGNFKVGDYWIFAARTATGKVEELDYELPFGVKHHYCRLALVKWPDGSNAPLIEDCRKEFPPLTELPKGETSKGKGCCTVTVGKSGDYPDIRQAVHALNQGQGPGTVCVLPGIYWITEPISIKGRDITILGCESASLILCPSNKAIFEISDSDRVKIINLWAITSGDRVIQSVNSKSVRISNCVMAALGISLDAGTVVFQGTSIASVIENCLLAGLVGVRFDTQKGNNSNLHSNARISQNTIYALTAAIFQNLNTPIMGFNLIDNILQSFSVNSLMKSFFPASFIKFADEKAMYDQDIIDKAKKIPRELIGVDYSDIAQINPLFQFINHLKDEAETAKIKHDTARLAQMAIGFPVIWLLNGAMDANFQNNIISGNIGIQAALLFEASIRQNTITVSETGISVGNFEGLTIDENLIIVRNQANSAGIRCTGEVSLNLTVTNNRLSGGAFGVEFGVESKLNTVTNAQISQNFIDVLSRGINIENDAIWIYDFTAFDNSIRRCSEYGIILNGYNVLSDYASFQRVIQRNSVQVEGNGIKIGINDVKILDNDITIKHKGPVEPQDLSSYGILIHADNCTVENNSIKGIVNQKDNLCAKGGIYICIYTSSAKSNLIIKTNRISGGIGNGIEIASDLNGAIIDNNFLNNMCLNGIAVSNTILNSNNLTISNNKILYCNLIEQNNTFKIVNWWKHAGIVLKSGKGIQIIGNEIRENGIDASNSNKYQQIQVGGIYAEQVSEIMIANNHLLDNGSELSQDAVIHICAYTERGNENIKVVDNFVKSQLYAALSLGRIKNLSTNEKRPDPYLDNKTVVTSNHFESQVFPVVKIQSNRLIFCNNHIECPGNENTQAVNLGYGWFVTVVGNVSSGIIETSQCLNIKKDLNIENAK